MTKPNKTALRRRFRTLRRHLAPDVQQANAHAVIRVLLTSGQLLRAQTIAGYAAADGELDLAPTFDRLWNMHRSVVLPVINRLSNRLDFYRHRRNEPLVQGHFNIPVPPLNADHVSMTRVDLVLLPLVAFDAHGTRLGMGGGFYDRTFAGVPARLRPRLVGVAHACQLSIDDLPRQAWDIPLDAVVTECGITAFRHSLARPGH